MVAALDSMNGVADPVVFVRRAAAVNSRPNAYVMRKHAEMAAAHQAQTKSFTRFVSLAGFPFNQTRDGGIVGVMPVDSIAWTKATARAMTDTSAQMRRVARGGNAELRISGTATNLAKQRLKELGWRLVENSRI